MTRKKIFICAIVIQIVAMTISIVCGAGGHGTYIPFRILFPYTMLSTVFYEDIWGPFIILMFVQYIVYGMIMCYSFNSKFVKQIYSAIAFCHVFAMSISFIFINKHFI